MRLLRWVVAVGLLSVVACEERSPPPAAIWVDPETIPPTVDCSATPNQRICEGHWTGQCGASGNARELVNCHLLDQTCVVGAGCRLCIPNANDCTEDNELYHCNAEGSAYEVTQACSETTVCSGASNACIDLCAAAEQSSSYVGCDYWAVTTSNAGLDDTFDFEVVVANPQSVTAQVSVEQGGVSIADVSVQPSQVRRIKLPWVDELVGREGAHTSHVRDGAYHVMSSVPVTVYQFNPMEFQKQGTPSFTNDASLLLPTHVLTGNYMVMARGSIGINFAVEGQDLVLEDSLPGMVAIVGVDANTAVEITSSAYTLASPDGAVPALMPGQTVTLMLDAGDVIQILSARQERCVEDDAVHVELDGTLRYCQPESDNDLTGTTIRASGRVSVLGGHDCSFVPFNTYACDHLEESIFPEEAWGKRVPIAVSAAVTGQRDLPDVVRVLSSHDGNQVTFQPPVHDDVTLDRGDFIELVAEEDFVVTGTEALLVAQFLVGQEYNDLSADTGDPAMSLGIPKEQWRNSYAFLTPNTYDRDFVNVIAPNGAPVTIDDLPITRWEPIEGTELAAARVAVSAGQHRMSSAVPFGITVYGYAPFTSYMYPGGLDLRVINGPD